MKNIAGVLCAAALLCAASCQIANRSSSPLVATEVGTKGDGDYVIGPDYIDAPESVVGAKVSRGTIKDFVMESTDSKIYPGVKGPYHRKVQLYIPAGYVAGTPAPFIVVQDGVNLHYADMTEPVLDNLIAQHRLPGIVGIFIDSGGGNGPGSERGLEYDTISDRYTKFIESEVLPRITKDYNVTFTTDPDGRAAMGGSSGGECAFTMGWFHPELYHRILTYSGTYINQQSPVNPETPHGGWEYHEHLIPASPAKPLRIWLEVGENDVGWDKPESSYRNWVMANQRMAAILKAKGYHYHYVYAIGAKHIDTRATKETLPEALLWLWRGYPINAGA